MSAAAIPYLAPPVDPSFARDVCEGLTKRRKTTPASWLYDEVGSALFEVITLLPEYGLTRADAALLSCSSGEIVDAAGRPRLIVELGSGTGTKTRHILAAAAHRNSVDYLPIDISPSALEVCKSALQSMPRVSVKPVEATYLAGIDAALAGRRPAQRALVLFLGSTIGNFSREEAAEFLSGVRERMKPGDALLLGLDLIKPRAKLIEAYDDPAGVTAAFNLNLLARMNRELAANFKLRHFSHEARYNERLSRVEMHLRSRVNQTVHIAAAELTVRFAEDETIWTESSHKFRAEDVAHLGESAGFHALGQWLDRDWGFAEALFGL